MRNDVGVDVKIAVITSAVVVAMLVSTPGIIVSSQIAFGVAGGTGGGPGVGGGGLPTGGNGNPPTKCLKGTDCNPATGQGQANGQGICYGQDAGLGTGNTQVPNVPGIALAIKWE